MESVPLASDQKKALKRIKALNKQMTEQSLDIDLANVSEHTHLKRNQLTHWRNG